MKNLFLIFGCLLILMPAAFAQSEPRANFFIGYSNLQAEGVTNPTNPNQPFNNDFFDRRRGLHGINAAVGGYFNSVVGIKGDFSFHRNEDSRAVTGGRDSVETQVYYFMAGPVMKFRNASRVEPFVHALAGGAHTRFEVETQRTVGTGTTRSTFDTGSTDFAAAIGGGVDIRLGDRFSLRAFQIDYAPVFLRDRSVSVLGGSGAIVPATLEGQRQDNIRISVGVVF
ncbi:MAG TPA: outer membrane beta-barrel protein [Blastocatellia bacterium]|nr:outer membrane beta-barrel protein [Blastocatellia bacterium]